MTVKTGLWDPTERLGTDEAQQTYLEDALENGDPALIVAVIGDIAGQRTNIDAVWLAVYHGPGYRVYFRRRGSTIIVPPADRLYDEHLKELEDEGAI